ncbi:hypothetical protein ORV05_34180 [Amycolatopsis cynarae]|uniref:Uncharacterized protein n=1 Tax=Amycolatopsis cynarae TaxID=2995223 RepID=A0ABY7B1K9_9PSEU|nr:hypothetical protein [Amycolatopsis sp. HUAS 11-8]WAL65849.1 hypothetical protein ORV05_34180 [Amycolatopsis sp. HUAS 11-8]
MYDPRSAEIARLAEETAEVLPTREALLTINTVVGVNLALALSLFGDAKAGAGQLLGAVVRH